MLLVSFDGFRWDYDQDVKTPNLDELVKKGVKAIYINPPAITMTSPSHFTTITGKARHSAYLYWLVCSQKTLLQTKKEQNLMPNSAKFAVSGYNFVMRTEYYDV